MRFRLRSLLKWTTICAAICGAVVYPDHLRLRAIRVLKSHHASITYDQHFVGSVLSRIFADDDSLRAARSSFLLVFPERDPKTFLSEKAMAVSPL